MTSSKPADPDAPPKSSGVTLRGDVFGGLTAAVIALPLALAFGVAAFAPMGAEHAPTGALVGLLGAIFTGFFAAWFGGTPSQVTGPTAPMTVVVTAFLVGAVERHGVDQLATILVLMAGAIMLGGLCQIILGLFGGGKLVKYIPYPVVSGFMNGIAILIFLGQLKPFFGVQEAWSDSDIAQAWVPMTIGTLTIAGVVVTKRLSKTIPASLVGLVVGIISYFALAAAGYVPLTLEDNALLVGAIPSPFSSLEQIKGLLPVFHLDGLRDVGSAEIVEVVVTGLTLGVLGSIDSLLTSVVADTVTHSRHDSRRELVGQGIGNLISGFCGGLAGAGATVRTLVNIGAGGRSKRSGMLHAAVILLVVVALGTPAGWIPLSALAGILFVTAAGMLDRYSLSLFRFGIVRSEFAIIVVVAIITVTVDLMIAVAVGMGIAALLFVWQQIQLPVIRRRLRGDEIFSRRVRGHEELVVLRDVGTRTIAYELSGALFFGTTDALQSEVEADQAKSDRFIFDFSRVEDLDLSGTRVLTSLFHRLDDAGKTVAVSGLADLERRRARVAKLLVRLKVLEKVPERHRHLTLDLALERFEQELIEEHLPRMSREIPIPLSECSGFKSLSPEERARFEEVCETVEAPAGETLAVGGEEAAALFIIRAGRVSVWKSGRAREVRLASLGPGALWGLSALVGGLPWMNTVRADSEVTYTVVEREDLVALREHAPELVLHLERALIAAALERLELYSSELALLAER